MLSAVKNQQPLASLRLCLEKKPKGKSHASAKSATISHKEKVKR